MELIRSTINLQSRWRMVRESERRPWADLPPELLNLIYEKLTPFAAAGSTRFGSVCKPWRQIQAAVPPPLPWYPLYRRDHPLFSPDRLSTVPDEIRDKLSAASVAYAWQSSGWLLLRYSAGGKIFGCFNPLLPWPQNYIKLPTRSGIEPYGPDTRVRAAFSSDPTGPDDWTIIVVGEQPQTISTFRRGDRVWKNYYHNHGRSEVDLRVYECVAIGFREGRFFCLFGTGDVLIFGGGEGRMLVADPRPPPVSPTGGFNLVSVERRGGEEGGSCLVVSWQRVADGDGGGGRRRRLAGVERRRTEEEATRRAELIVEGRKWCTRRAFVREDPEYTIHRDPSTMEFIEDEVSAILVFVSIVSSLYYASKLWKGRK